MAMTGLRPENEHLFDILAMPSCRERDPVTRGKTDEELYQMALDIQTWADEQREKDRQREMQKQAAHGLPLKPQSETK